MLFVTNTCTKSLMLEWECYYEYLKFHDMCRKRNIRSKHLFLYIYSFMYDTVRFLDNDKTRIYSRTRLYTIHRFMWCEDLNYYTCTSKWNRQRIHVFAINNTYSISLYIYSSLVRCIHLLQFYLNTYSVVRFLWPLVSQYMMWDRQSLRWLQREYYCFICLRLKPSWNSELSKWMN